MADFTDDQARQFYGDLGIFSNGRAADAGSRFLRRLTDAGWKVVPPAEPVTYNDGRKAREGDVFKSGASGGYYQIEKIRPNNDIDVRHVRGGSLHRSWALLSIYTYIGHPGEEKAEVGDKVLIVEEAQPSSDSGHLEPGSVGVVHRVDALTAWVDHNPFLHKRYVILERAPEPRFYAHHENERTWTVHDRVGPTIPAACYHFGPHPDPEGSARAEADRLNRLIGAGQ